MHLELAALMPHSRVHIHFISPHTPSDMAGRTICFHLPASPSQHQDVDQTSQMPGHAQAGCPNAWLQNANIKPLKPHQGPSARHARYQCRHDSGNEAPLTERAGSSRPFKKQKHDIAQHPHGIGVLQPGDLLEGDAPSEAAAATLAAPTSPFPIECVAQCSDPEPAPGAAAVSPGQVWAADTAAGLAAPAAPAECCESADTSVTQGTSGMDHAVQPGRDAAGESGQQPQAGYAPSSLASNAASQAAAECAAGVKGASDAAAAAAAQSAPADQTSTAVNPWNEVAEPEGPSGIQEIGDQPEADTVQSIGYVKLSWWTGCHHEVANSVEAIHGRPHIIWAPNAGMPFSFKRLSVSLEELAWMAGNIQAIP